MKALPEVAYQIWPQTVAGWVTLVMAVLGLLAALYSYAKNLAHLNGLGERVTAVEKGLEKIEERETQWLRALDKVTSAQDALLEAVGRANKGAETCGDDMQKFAIDVGSKVDELRRIVNDEGRRAGERLQAIETELRLTRRA